MGDPVFSIRQSLSWYPRLNEYNYRCISYRHVWFGSTNIITTLIILYEFSTTPRVKPPSHVANIMAAQNKKSKNTETRQTNNS